MTDTQEKKSDKKKTGRPTVFTPEILDEILLRIANGEVERRIFDQEGMPTWRAWTYYKIKAAESNQPFILQYAQAKESGYEVWERDILDIAEDDSKDVLETTVTFTDKNGNVHEKTERRSDNTPVNRARLRIDSMKWLMSKIMSKKYGDYQKLEHTGKDGKELQIVVNISGKKD